VGMGVSVGGGVAGAVGKGAGALDAAPGGGPDLTAGVSTSGSSLCGGLTRVNGGLPGGG
jgi:hypothetical protein